ncbi:MAG: methionine--tRNA ligase, partial [Proteobacteria bacterium]|nr:methionine--tRNA ligase [Pseudomonadota bacterium]
LSWPVIPDSARKIHDMVMPAPDIIPWPDQKMKDFLSQLKPGRKIHSAEVLFAKITDEQVAEWEKRFGGTQD